MWPRVVEGRAKRPGLPEWRMDAAYFLPFPVAVPPALPVLVRVKL